MPPKFHLMVVVNIMALTGLLSIAKFLLAIGKNNHRAILIGLVCIVLAVCLYYGSRIARYLLIVLCPALAVLKLQALFAVPKIRLVSTLYIAFDLAIVAILVWSIGLLIFSQNLRKQLAARRQKNSLPPRG
jgi:hypothetical protein